MKKKNLIQLHGIGNKLMAPMALLALSVVGVVSCGKLDGSWNKKKPDLGSIPSEEAPPEETPEYSFAVDYINKVDANTPIVLTAGTTYPVDGAAATDTEFDLTQHCSDPALQVYKFRIRNTGDLPITTANIAVAKITDYTNSYNLGDGMAALSVLSSPSVPIAIGAEAEFEVKMDITTGVNNACALGGVGGPGGTMETAKIILTTDEGNSEYLLNIFGQS